MNRTPVEPIPCPSWAGALAGCHEWTVRPRAMVRATRRGIGCGICVGECNQSHAPPERLIDDFLACRAVLCLEECAGRASGEPFLGSSRDTPVERLLRERPACLMVHADD